MVQGTASHVGKSTLVTALCRILRQDGHRVAPFKSQNMALNSFVAAEGGEIGRAQAVQAEAAGLDPSLDMNPILLKPEGDARSQVIVNGRSVGSRTAADYQRWKLELWPTVTDALDRLRAAYDVVVVEGAGSPAEINLRHADLANMRVALHAEAPVLLVGDIDRGGVFASLYGTLALLEPAERALVCGFAINKFRGDPAILEPGLEMLRERTGVPVLGVIPLLQHLDLPEEDSLGIADSRHDHDTADGSDAKDGVLAGDRTIDVAVIRLPRIANFDDFAPLAADSRTRVRYVERASQLGRPSLVMLPGTKTTIEDLAWLRASGLADAILQLSAERVPIFGVCGGYQMLGQHILDPDGVESDRREAAGLGLLPIETTFEAPKRTCRIVGTVVADSGLLAAARRSAVIGYEIHMGRTDARGAVRPLLRITERSGEAANDLDGLVSDDGLVAGTYVHGLFDNDDLRHALLNRLAGASGSVSPPRAVISTRLAREAQYDALADAVRASLDIGALKRASGLD